jgi:hypothetical protein
VLVKRSKSQIVNAQWHEDSVSQFLDIFLPVTSGSVLLHRQRSPEELQQLVAWYKVRSLWTKLCLPKCEGGALSLLLVVNIQMLSG